MPHEPRTETSLYGPVKRYLETLGYMVKGEVCGCDLVALRGDEPPIVVIGELKLSFSLDLVLQDRFWHGELPHPYQESRY